MEHRFRQGYHDSLTDQNPDGCGRDPDDCVRGFGDRGTRPGAHFYVVWFAFPENDLHGLGMGWSHACCRHWLTGFGGYWRESRSCSPIQLFLYVLIVLRRAMQHDLRLRGFSATSPINAQSTLFFSQHLASHIRLTLTAEMYRWTCCLVSRALVSTDQAGSS
jgi:hypothetical protein